MQRLCFDTSTDRICFVTRKLTFVEFMARIGVSDPAILQGLVVTLSPIIRENRNLLLSSGDLNVAPISPLIRDALPPALKPYANDIAGYLVGNLILDRLSGANGDSLVTTSGISGGSVAAGGISNLVNQAAYYALNQTGLGGVQAMAESAAIASYLTPVIGEYLGTGTLINTGLGGVIGQTAGPYINQALSQYGVNVPPFVTNAAAGALGGYLVSGLVNTLI